MQQQIKIYDFEQRSPEWYQIREGKITASGIINILGKDTLATTKGAIDNLAIKLATEQVFGMIENDFVSFDMQRGIDMEPSAIGLLADILATEFIDISKVGFIEHSEHIGCSPDGLASNNFTAESKCPNPENFFKLCITREIDRKHYAQVQHQIFCKDAAGGYYINYCVHRGKEYHILDVIERDEPMQALIKSRCEDVIEKKLRHIPILEEMKHSKGITPIHIQLHDQTTTVHEIIKG